MFKLFNPIISWCSKKKIMVAISSSVYEIAYQKSVIVIFVDQIPQTYIWLKNTFEHIGPLHLEQMLPTHLPHLLQVIQHFKVVIYKAYTIEILDPKGGHLLPSIRCRSRNNLRIRVKIWWVKFGFAKLKPGLSKILMPKSVIRPIIGLVLWLNLGLFESLIWHISLLKSLFLTILFKIVVSSMFIYTNKLVIQWD